MNDLIKNDLSKKYSKGTIVIHWLSFLLILALIPTGFLMSNVQAEEKLLLLKIHLITGIIVFVLTLIRSWFFFRQQRPPKLETGKTLHNKLVVWIENSFYIILILLSITGMATIATSGLGEVLMNSKTELLSKTIDVPPLAVHKALAIILIILLLGHIGGVVNHYLKNKENTLKRILP